ncbi:gp352 [Bacillus phage G]|uniref:Gp352 n=1 Tax=Bacillus phage G TaxID=2884420 RepID=G3MA93_9CAUD|nr:gp352 [Bacillus phage G]AEO93611.1 gp352 [Bacillus phage G]
MSKDKTMHDNYIEKDHPRWNDIDNRVNTIRQTAIEAQDLSNRAMTEALLANRIHIGESEPESLIKVWIDGSDESVDEVFHSPLSQDIRDTVTSVKQTADALEYALNYELDPGYFKGILPGTDPNLPKDPNKPDLSDGAEGTVGRVKVKRGLKEDIGDLHEGEFGFCLDTEELYIGNKGTLKLIAKVGGVSTPGGSNGNVTADYVELISQNGIAYKLTVNDEGEPIILNSDVDNVIPPAQSESGRFNGLFISKVYGGGGRDTNSTPVSHSFIELYNSTDSPMNLKGLSLQYGEYLQSWKILPLRGIIKPYCSFLIRCGKHSDPNRRSTRFKVLDFDMSWDIPISANGYKVYLSVGTEKTPFDNPANTDGQWTKAIGYINMFSVGGDDVSKTIDGYEKGYLHIANKYRMTKRKYSESTVYLFANTGDNRNDIDFVDMREANIETYMPRSTGYGQWYFDYDQMKLDTHTPNVVNICFGYDGDTSRTFTWQTPVTNKGYIKYKLKNSDDWITLSSSRKFVALQDADVTVHSVILSNLQLGSKYVYKVGYEGNWSDEYEIDIIDKTNNSSVTKILWVTDQQGWDKSEYSAWSKAANYIEKNETYDFIINTGDIAQNANRPFEWREYYEGMKNSLSTMPHMTCVGNNDLIDKLYSEAYTYYSTVENSPYPSVYSWNHGLVHYIVLDSNILTDPLNSAEYIRGTAEQIDFINQDMSKAGNKKRWIICLIHESSYTIVRSAKLKPFINVLYDAGVDLVICGHHHCYHRSLRMGRLGENDVDVVDETNGVYYLMLQAAGYKLSGKTIPTPNAPWRALYDRPGDPMYATFEISYDKIEYKAYRLTNIMPLIDNVGKEVVPILFDTLTILPKANRGN